MQGRTYRTVGELPQTDRVMNDTFWLGVYPGLTQDHLEHAARSLEAFLGIGF
jgi:CDP-6-deoxy-D-xylo-4-hexulose-3-dehydrase